MILWIAIAAAATLPPPEATEQWSPTPPVVSAPAGAPPSDAVILFDGKGLDAWEGAAWRIEGDAIVVEPGTGDIRTKQSFGDVQLHLEFRTPSPPRGEGQGRGNSGVFLMGLYELQVLDSWNSATYVNGQAGSVYKQHPPLVNASRAPGEWQTYDVIFLAPRFTKEKVIPARMTVFHNGVLVQHDVKLRGGTVFRGRPTYEPHAAKLPITLQDHRDRVAFRNIWARDLSLR